MKFHKKYWCLLIAICLGWIYNVQACDVCGCGPGYYLGILPQYQQNFLGMRYVNRAFDTHLNPGAFAPAQENFQSIEVWGRYYPIPRLQFLASVPFRRNTQMYNGLERVSQGVGDAIITGSYQLLKKLPVNGGIQYQWWIGTGVKLPTGNSTYDQYDYTQVANPNFQPGSGSLDYLLTSQFIIRKGGLGLNTQLFAKYNTFNKEGFKIGHQFQGAHILYYTFKSKEKLFMPQLGISYELAQKDIEENRYEVQYSGGHQVYGRIGGDVYIKWFSIGVDYALPLWGELSEGAIRAKDGWSIRTSYKFGKE